MLCGTLLHSMQLIAGAESLDDSCEAEAQEVSRPAADSAAMQRGTQAERQAQGAEHGGRTAGKAKRGRPTGAEDSANAGQCFPVVINTGVPGEHWV